MPYNILYVRYFALSIKLMPIKINRIDSTNYNNLIYMLTIDNNALFYLRFFNLVPLIKLKINL